MKILASLFGLVLILSLFSAGGQAPISDGDPDGEALFMANCAACHRTGSKRLVGPGLKGVSKKRSKEWLYAFVRDAQALIDSGDKDALAIYEEYEKIPHVPFQHLLDEEIDAIFEFIDSVKDPEAAGEDEELVPNLEILDSGQDTETAEEEKQELAPKPEITDEDKKSGQPVAGPSAIRLDLGRGLFVHRCEACHFTSDQTLIGPGLKDIGTKRSLQWLRSWIADPEALLKSGDPDARQVFEEFGEIAHPMQKDLKTEEIDMIIDYINYRSKQTD